MSVIPAKRIYSGCLPIAVWALDPSEQSANYSGSAYQPTPPAQGLTQLRAIERFRYLLDVCNSVFHWVEYEKRRSCQPAYAAKYLGTLIRLWLSPPDESDSKDQYMMFAKKWISFVFAQNPSGYILSCFVMGITKTQRLCFSCIQKKCNP